MRFEDVLHEIGGFNKFQFLVLYILWLPRVILPLHFLLHNFISGVPPHHCALPHLDDRYAGGTEKDGESAQILAFGIPRNADGSYSSCKMYPLPLDFDPNGDLSRLYGNRSNVSVPCQHGWVYDRSQFTSTTATEVRICKVLSSISVVLNSKALSKTTYERPQDISRISAVMTKQQYIKNNY